MTPCPKPERPVRGTAACRAHMARVAQLPCVVCKRPQVQVHHCIHDRYASRRASDMEVIPLCQRCHDDLHRDKAAWRQRHGADHEYLDWVTDQIYGEKR